MVLAMSPGYMNYQKGSPINAPRGENLVVFQRQFMAFDDLRNNSHVIGPPSGGKSGQKKNEKRLLTCSPSLSNSPRHTPSNPPWLPFRPSTLPSPPCLRAGVPRRTSRPLALCPPPPRETWSPLALTSWPTLAEYVPHDDLPITLLLRFCTTIDHY